MIVFAAILIVLGVRTFILDLALVEGLSMYPTMKPGSVVVILRCAYGLRLPGGNYLLRWSRSWP
jgi:signal peptidase I